MIDRETKLGVLKVLGYLHIFPNPDKAPVDALWAQAIVHSDLYLHKKGGIYRKQDERSVLDTDIVIVNYEHIYPHARAPGCRLREEWQTPGRFVKITE